MFDEHGDRPSGRSAEEKNPRTRNEARRLLFQRCRSSRRSNPDRARPAAPFPAPQPQPWPAGSIELSPRSSPVSCPSAFHPCFAQADRSFISNRAAHTPPFAMHAVIIAICKGETKIGPWPKPLSTKAAPAEGT